MHTPADVAKLAGVTPQTIRNYTTVYGEFLTHQDRHKGGARLYTDEDVEMLCTIAALRASGLPPDAVMERLRDDTTPPFIDVSPSTPSIDPVEGHRTGNTGLYDLQVYQPIIAGRFDAIERHMEAYMAELRIELRQRRKYDVLWGILLGGTLALMAGAFLLWVLWLYNTL